MSEKHLDSADPRLDALHRRMAEHSLGGHWQPREGKPELVPFLWPWATIYSCLIESGEVVKLGHIDEAAKRRTVQLVNPAIRAQKATSRTLQMSVQLVKAGERAECHRHTAAALRFVVEGDGTGYTSVEGEQMFMEPGDLVLTPSWTWHDHYNPGSKPLVWLDVLDVHLVSHLDANIQENYGEGPAQPVVKPDGFCRRRLGAIRPRTPNTNGRALPYTYKWRDTLHALNEMAAAGEKDPCDGILLEYANPITGGPTMPTIGCWIQMVSPAETTRPHRHTSSSIYHVVQGEGVTIVGDKRSGGQELRWTAKDCFFVPSSKWHHFKNTSRTEPAIIFSVTDRPVLESLGLYREERE
ncbi:MAG TPA: cupin domain-containing protein [Candidatus Eisenbacteria bacterium]|nr:cupin domain-containing protein [Candidatus Eisenbacteria bacterium]